MSSAGEKRNATKGLQPNGRQCPLSSSCEPTPRKGPTVPVVPTSAATADCIDPKSSTSEVSKARFTKEYLQTGRQNVRSKTLHLIFLCILLVGNCQKSNNRNGPLRNSACECGVYLYLWGRGLQTAGQVPDPTIETPGQAYKGQQVIPFRVVCLPVRSPLHSF